MAILQSQLFSKPAPDPKLEACLVDDSAHIVQGSRGEHVEKIQIALNMVINAGLGVDGIYGPKTAVAVRDFKNAASRRILQSWQTTADDIVGKRTIKQLDDELLAIEAKKQQPTGLVSLDEFGSLHDHVNCPRGYANQKVHHQGTPINPQRTGRMINIGGEKETQYLGFEDFMPDPSKVWIDSLLGRPLTKDLPDGCASDICLRYAPIGPYLRKEIERIARPRCRLTYANTSTAILATMDYLRSLGPIIEHDSFDSINSQGLTPNQAVVVTMVSHIF